MGHKLKIKCVHSKVNVHNLASTGVPFTLTTVQVPNLALTHKKGITVYNELLKKVQRYLLRYRYPGNCLPVLCSVLCLVS
jgi:hypothetical protein